MWRVVAHVAFEKATTSNKWFTVVAAAIIRIDRRCVHLFAVRIESRGHDFFETSFRRTDDLARMIPTRQPRMKSSHRRATLSGEWILQGRDDGIRHVNRVFSPCNLRIESLFYLPLNATVLLICGGGGLNDNRGASGFSWTTLCVSIAIHTRLSSVKHSYALWSINLQFRSGSSVNNPQS